MSEQPKFLRDYSKVEHAEERNEAAARIREARAEKSEAIISEPQLSESAEAATSTYKELGSKLESLTTGGVNRVKEVLSWVGIKRKLAQPSSTETSLGTISVPPQFEDPKKLLDDFYASERERWAKTEGNPEEMKQLFSEEHLASLSMEDYVLLLKRFPSAMVTHVTRQGIRDHTGMWEHTKGRGEYMDGFMKILQEGELKSPLAVSAAEHGKEEAIAKALKLDRADSREDAQSRLKDSLDSAFDGYADVAAVHVATEEVADHFYGSEKGNEIFIAYPSAHVASEHEFIGKLASGTDNEHNDTWILTDKNLDKGMDINAGVIFISAEAKVNPETGSCYALDELKRPVEDEQAKLKVSELVNSDEFQGWMGEMIQENRKDREIASLIGERFGIANPDLQMALANKGKLQKFSDPGITEKRKEETVAQILEKSGLQYKKAENTISSQEFWEHYFAQHPEQRPSKIEYYKGNDPTGALLSWKKKHGLTNAGTESSYDLGGRIDDISEHQSEGKDRFKSIAEKIIDDRFTQEEPNQSLSPEQEEQIANIEMSLISANRELEQLRSSGAPQDEISEVMGIIQNLEVRRDAYGKTT